MSKRKRGELEKESKDSQNQAYSNLPAQLKPYSSLPTQLVEELFSDLEIKIDLQKKYITIEGVKYQYREKSHKKGEGISPGWMLYPKEAKLGEEAKPVGMIKRAKSQLLHSKSEDDYSIIGECLAMGLASIFTLPTPVKKSKSRMVRLNIDSESRMALFSIFDKKIPLESVLVGNNPKRNNGALKATGDGYVAPGFDYIEDLSQYLTYFLLLNDNDAIGKAGNNAAFIPDDKDPNLWRLFIYDKFFYLSFLEGHQMYIDERFNIWTPFYQKRMQDPPLYFDFIGRHGAIRNYSVITDGHFSTKFMSYLKAEESMDYAYLFLNLSEKRLKALPFDPKEILEYSKKLAQVKEQLNDRWKKIENSLKPLTDLHQAIDSDEQFLACIDSFEKYFSPTLMFSEEGVPLRTLHVMNDKPRTTLKISKKIGARVISIDNAPLDLVKFLSSDLKEYLKEEKSAPPNSNIFFVKESDWVNFKKTFINEFNTSRVQVRKHPETACLLNPDFPKNKLILLPPQTLKYIRNDLLYMNYEKFYKKYTEEKRPHQKLKMLKKLLSEIDEILSAFDSSDSPYGKPVLKHLAASALKEQQLILLLLKQNFDVNFKQKLGYQSAEEGLHHFFKKAHTLDLTASINRLLIRLRKKVDNELDIHGLTILEEFKDAPPPLNYQVACNRALYFQNRIKSFEVSFLKKTATSRSGIFNPNLRILPNPKPQAQALNPKPSS